MAKKTKRIPLHDKVTSRNKATIQRENPDNYLSMRPAWRFHRAVPAERIWSIYQNDGKSFVEHILPKLREIENMSWTNIIQSEKHKSHNVEIGSLTKKAQNELQELKIYQDELFSLRLTSKKRLWGILEEGVLNILWYDPEHEICPSNKKHT